MRHLNVGFSGRQPASPDCTGRICGRRERYPQTRSVENRNGLQKLARHAFFMFDCFSVEAAMLEHVRSFGLCRPKKKDHALAVLLFCALLCAPSPSFASSGAADGIMPVNPKAVRLEIGRRGGSLTSHGDMKTLTAPSGDVTDDAKSLRHTVEGSPGRFPYLCSLRMAGSRKHECTATLVGERWVLTAAHCVDPNHDGSVGCYPTVYCGVDQVNTISAKTVSCRGQDAVVDSSVFGGRGSTSKTPTSTTAGRGTKPEAPTWPCSSLTSRRTWKGRCCFMTGWSTATRTC